MAQPAHSFDKPGPAEVKATVGELRSLAIRALKRMYRPEEGMFAFRLRRGKGGLRMEGVSRRYTAIVLIGLASEGEVDASTVLAGRTPQDVCGRLLKDADRMDDLGEVALTLWAARVLGHHGAARALDRLRSLAPDREPYPTVEIAWSLTALAVEGSDAGDEALAHSIANRLLSSFRGRSGLFPHWPDGAQPSRLRSHVACYADVVYPIQALSHYYRATGSPQALEAARCCARRMCELQGPEGQWWWHYDVRTGRVVERFPVYAVHQDAMGPMALFALEEAGGGHYAEPIARSVQWLADSAELHASLIDKQADVIWRKVARHEPGKLTRGIQAMVSRLHPALRLPGTDLVFRPGRLDYESRPYHMGWILHAWPADRVSQSPAA